MDPFPLPSFEFLGNASAMLAVFGTVNLYDAELRAVRIGLDAAPTVDVDFYLPGAFAMAVPEGARATGYRITLRCTGVTVVHADDLSVQNIVGDYGFEAPASDGTQRLWVRGTVGCDLEVRCAGITVAQVQPSAPAP